MSEQSEWVRAEVGPSGTGCVECEELGDWWVHLRRCAYCGHVGCCDDSLGQHSTAHARSSGHLVIQSYEPGEDWFWDFGADEMIEGPQLAAPDSHPESQSAPGPADRLPADWQRILMRRRAQG
ncbi:UBP-type zinc finger domain-containing protein [uncultured Microbacterium sp.]|uniref:UBP-type zinc finger domain-containing protein n=1 Tax=uncultured Microbacterium sp. TaxID=191216 RepID=UPI0035C98B31